MKSLWCNYNLSIVLLALFLARWIGQAVFQWFEMAKEAQAHGVASTLAEFIPAFFLATFENWQSEFLQLFSMMVLTAFPVHKGSHESKDQDEKVDQTGDLRLQKLTDGFDSVGHALMQPGHWGRSLAPFKFGRKTGQGAWTRR